MASIYLRYLNFDKIVYEIDTNRFTILILLSNGLRQLSTAGVGPRKGRCPWISPYFSVWVFRSALIVELTKLVLDRFQALAMQKSCNSIYLGPCLHLSIHILDRN
jgi:hypothetical protein